MKIVLYVEGGGQGRGAKLTNSSCREGFAKLLARCGLEPRRLQIVPCGGRAQAYRDFCSHHAHNPGRDFIALLVDSEEPVVDLAHPWAHLKNLDGWDAPPNTDAAQVQFMTTCMETWIVTDRAALAAHFGQDLQTSALPPLTSLEARDRQSIQQSLHHATRNCRKPYAKGPPSYAVLAKLSPPTLAQHLPSFERCQRTLKAKLSW